MRKKHPTIYLINSKRRTSPHRLWLFVLLGTIAGLGLELLFFSWYFLKTTNLLDAPPVLEADQTQQKIDAITKQVTATEKVVENRTKQQ